MIETIAFGDAISATDGEDRTLLIGNGFSSQYFKYADLLEKSEIAAGTPIRKLFDELNSKDFEKVVRALEDAALVCRAYGRDDHCNEHLEHAQNVREALVKAINVAHPTHREKLDLQYESAAQFLGNFSTVFSLNYDLLLYWVNLQTRKLRDGFGLGSKIRDGMFQSPFTKDAYCEIFNLQGGLHLFDDGTGETMKALDVSSGVVSTITAMIAKGKAMPIYVAEGTSEAKLLKIKSNQYLRHCLEKLEENTSTVFVYGHSADENDNHIYQAIFGSKAKHVYFGVHNATKEKLDNLNGQLAKYQKSVGSSIEYTFYPSESAEVWGKA